MDDLLVQTIRPPSKIKPLMKDQALKQWLGLKGNRVILEKGTDRHSKYVEGKIPPPNFSFQRDFHLTRYIYPSAYPSKAFIR
ncbi:hypothetical protein CEXT_725971 [Caerostris extrusa]|uniref:Uncharacterized protein n=1 Tax=Caerostris extrusa TaxID=172846 RepID=A0AAV4M511_CAEEX|nr:hypothetical protein CEXT_725971 [Caerostris extrusa]